MSRRWRERTFDVQAAQGAVVSATEFSLGAPTSAAHSTPFVPAPTILLVHGWSLTHRSWLPVIRNLLSHHALRVITYDQRGHGRSTWGRARSASVRDLGNDLDAVIAATAPTGDLVLAGHSMGGMTIMAYAAQHPDAFAQRVRGTVIVSSAGRVRAGKTYPIERLVMGVAARAPRVIPARVPAAIHRRTLFGLGADPRDVQDTSLQVGRTKLVTVGRYFTSLHDHDELESIAALASAPTTVLVGSHDRLTPVSWSRELHDGIPGSRLKILPGKGHMLTYEATTEVADAVRAAAQLSPGTKTPGPPSAEPPIPP